MGSELRGWWGLLLPASPSLHYTFLLPFKHRRLNSLVIVFFWSVGRSSRGTYQNRENLGTSRSKLMF